MYCCGSYDIAIDGGSGGGGACGGVFGGVFGGGGGGALHAFGEEMVEDLEGSRGGLGFTVEPDVGIGGDAVVVEEGFLHVVGDADIEVGVITETRLGQPALNVSDQLLRCLNVKIFSFHNDTFLVIHAAKVQRFTQLSKFHKVSTSIGAN